MPKPLLKMSYSILQSLLMCNVCWCTISGPSLVQRQEEVLPDGRPGAGGPIPSKGTLPGPGGRRDVRPRTASPETADRRRRHGSELPRVPAIWPGSARSPPPVALDGLRHAAPSSEPRRGSSSKRRKWVRWCGFGMEGSEFCCARRVQNGPGEEFCG